jgi:hypothetical protein
MGDKGTLDYSRKTADVGKRANWNAFGRSANPCQHCRRWIGQIITPNQFAPLPDAGYLTEPHGDR